MNRRSFLLGAAAVAPAAILTPGLLMRVRPLWTPDDPMTASEVARLLDQYARDLERAFMFPFASGSDWARHRAAEIRATTLGQLDVQWTLSR